MRACKIDRNQPENIIKHGENSGRVCCCAICSVSFKSYYRTKYCNLHKKEARHAQGGAGKERRKTGSTIKKCLQCNAEFRAHNSAKRKYCSYACHLDSGGAKRAGEAAVMAKRKYGNKKDANHHEVFNAILEITTAKDLSDAGCGVPDGLAWVEGAWLLFDVKNPKTGYGKRGLNERQKKWAIDWKGGPVYLIYNEDEARLFAKGELDTIKRFPDEAVGVKCE